MSKNSYYKYYKYIISSRTAELGNDFIKTLKCLEFKMFNNKNHHISI